MKHKIYKKSNWSWFYRLFIKNTINDNFYTPKEIVENNKELIDDVNNMEFSNNKEFFNKG